MRSRYFSCSKLADWVRGTPKLDCGTSEEWDDWRETAKKLHPLRYWLAEEGLDNLQNFIMYPVDKLYSIKYWILNRYVTKTHALTSTLKKGEWHEIEERILYCLFDELVNFVEIDVAWKNVIYNGDPSKKYNAPWYSKGWWNLRVWRDAKCGLDYLDWESTLVMDESYGLNKQHSDYGKPTDQAINAQEISTLYHWWKYERVMRKEPYEISGWNDYCEKNSPISYDKETPEERQQVVDLLQLSYDIEKKYLKEDQRMLIRLIKIRTSLWT